MISVVIATRNRRPFLERTLDALDEQELSFARYEVIVVDNGSTDGTIEWLIGRTARGTGASTVAIREGQPGKSHAVNRALQAARGNVVVFTDDDVVPDRDWLTAYERVFDAHRCDFAVGRISPLWEVPPPRWMSPALHGVLAVPDNGPVPLDIAPGQNEHIMPIGANMAMTREACQRLGGWRTDLGKLEHSLRSGEDHELFLRMLGRGFRGRYEPAARVRHLVPASRLHKRYFRRWLFDNGVVVSDIERAHPRTATRLFGLPRYLWREAATDLRRHAVAMARRDEAARFAHEVRLLWFAGYLLRSWTPRRQWSPTHPGLSLEHR